MKGTFDDDLCYAKPIGLQESAFMLPLGRQVALKGGKFVGDHPERPTPVPFDGEDSRRRHRFIARAERAVFLIRREGIPLFLLLKKLVRPLCSFCSNDNSLL
jgi:hypothetical protein